MARKSYKLSNENKLNNKSELQSKSDLVVLTNYKKLEDNFFVEAKNQEVKSEGHFDSIDYTLSKKDELIKKLENLKQFREQLKDGQKYLLENYTKLMPLQEAEKKEFEELIKEFEQFCGHLENGQKYLLEMYTELTIISEAEKRELEKVNNIENSPTLSRLGYENLDLIGLKENWEKLNEKFEQFRNEFENTKKLQEKLEKENKIKESWIAQIHDELIFEINKSNFKLEENTKLQIENKWKYVSEMYANLEKLPEADKKEYKDYSSSSQSDSYEEEHDIHFLIETSYNHGIPSSSSQVIYDNQYVKELNSEIDKKEFEYDSSNEKWSGEELEI